MRRSVIDRLDSDGVLSSSSLGLLAYVSHEPAAGHEAVPVVGCPACYETPAKYH